ncbi:CdiA family toxin C-terminal domain-containing protein, partial [Pseudomonas aeruginosa]|nr:CdiA family toxin C-terminal domain-containing protein [Pseudomonas aeruginosa]MBV6296632.1 CdiA family toxin C-terminal domain-containing protein [Pseudomonas aeruginosa]
ALRSATKTACRSSNPNPGYTKFCTPSVSTKTTYDPKILPDSKVADMSSRAAVQAESVFKANPALRETSIKVDGYYFQVTRNSKTGEITNSFIAMPPRIK